MLYIYIPYNQKDKQRPRRYLRRHARDVLHEISREHAVALAVPVTPRRGVPGRVLVDTDSVASAARLALIAATLEIAHRSADLGKLVTDPAAETLRNSGWTKHESKRHT